MKYLSDSFRKQLGRIKDEIIKKLYNKEKVESFLLSEGCLSVEHFNLLLKIIKPEIKFVFLRALYELVNPEKELFLLKDLINFKSVSVPAIDSCKTSGSNNLPRSIDKQTFDLIFSINHKEIFPSDLHFPMPQCLEKLWLIYHIMSEMLLFSSVIILPTIVCFLLS